jgi:hypothetical protein
MIICFNRSCREVVPSRLVLYKQIYYESRRFARCTFALIDISSGHPAICSAYILRSQNQLMASLERIWSNIVSNSPLSASRTPPSTTIKPRKAYAVIFIVESYDYAFKEQIYGYMLLSWNMSTGTNEVYNIKVVTAVFKIDEAQEECDRLDSRSRPQPTIKLLIQRAPL